jgi:hypothetical protein
VARGSLEETHSCAIAKEGYVLALSFLVATTFELEGPAFSFRFASRQRTVSIHELLHFHQTHSSTCLADYISHVIIYVSRPCQRIETGRMSMERKGNHKSCTDIVQNIMQPLQLDLFVFPDSLSDEQNAPRHTP